MAWLSNYRILWVIIFVLIALNLSSLGALWMTRERKPLIRLPERHANPHDHFLKRALDLSAEQAQRFDELEENHRKFIDETTREILVLRRSLMDHMQQPSMDDAGEDIIDKINRKQAELELRNYRHFKALSEILDDQQRSRFTEIMHRAFRRERGVPPHGRARSADRHVPMPGEKLP